MATGLPAALRHTQWLQRARPCLHLPRNLAASAVSPPTRSGSTASLLRLLAPAAVLAIERRGHQVKVLAEVSPMMPEERIPQPEVLRFPSGSSEAHAYFYAPEFAQRLPPVIVFIHGRPTSHLLSGVRLPHSVLDATRVRSRQSELSREHRIWPRLSGVAPAELGHNRGRRRVRVRRPSRRAAAH